MVSMRELPQNGTAHVHPDALRATRTRRCSLYLLGESFSFVARAELGRYRQRNTRGRLKISFSELPAFWNCVYYYFLLLLLNLSIELHY